MMEGEVKLRRVYGYLVSAFGAMNDGARSPFLADMKSDFEWCRDYYEDAIGFIDDHWREHFKQI